MRVKFYKNAIIEKNGGSKEVFYAGSVFNLDDDKYCDYLNDWMSGYPPICLREGDEYPKNELHWCEMQGRPMPEHLIPVENEPAFDEEKNPVEPEIGKNKRSIDLEKNPIDPDDENESEVV